MKLKSMSNKDRYGNMFSVEFFEPDASIPMMMLIPEMEGNGFNGADTNNHPGKPKGTDTVPAWLTPGENVVNAEASRLPGNQEKIDEMNEQGRAIQQAQGGPIPSYAAGGMEIPRPDGMLNSLGNKLSARDGGPMYSAVGDFVTDDLLNRLRMVESGGNANATSEAGAMGQYQIMPSTAAQPGYGVTPLAAKDIRDPAKSREFARQYLMGIAAANPDFTEDEVITAYHSGVGNVRKAKEGTEALGPRGQAYAAKVADASGVGPDAFGVSRRQVATVPNPNATPPAAPAPVVKTYSRFGKSDDYQKVGNDWYRVKADGSLAADPASGLAASSLNRQAAADVPEVPPVAAPPDDFANVEDLSPTGDWQSTQAQQQAAVDVAETGTSLANAKEELTAATKNLEDKRKAKKVTSEDIARLEAAKAAVPALEAANKEALTVKTKEDAADAKAISDASIAKQVEQDRLNRQASDALGVPPLDATPEYDPEATGEDLSPADQAAADKAKAAEDLAKQNPATKPVTQPDKDVTDAGKQKLKEDPTFAESITQGFKDLFSEMFEPKEIARMIVNYAGSRALGYDHGTSLNYSAQTYTKTIAADLAARKKFITNKDNLENFTTESLKRYQETGDIGVLEDKGGSAPNYNQTSGNAFIKGIGVVQKFKDSKSGVEAVEYNGELIPVTDPRIIKLIEPWNEGVYGAAKTKQGFLDFAKGQGSYLNNEAGLKSGTKNDTSYDDRVDFPEEKLAQEANNRFREILKQNGASVRDIPDLMNDVNSAMSRFMEDTIAYKQDRRKTKPISIRAYINDSTIQALTDVPQSQIGATSVNNTNELNKRIKDSMRITNPKDPRYAEDYYNQWQSTYQAYRSLPLDVKNKFVADAAKQIADNPKDETKHYSGFTLWASKTSDSEVAKIITELKAAGKL